MFKTYTHGTHRIYSPGATLERIAPHLASFGITRIANVTGLDRINLPVFMVCRPNAASLSVSQGKGITTEAAKVSGLMEAIECFHAEEIDLPITQGSYSELSRISSVTDVSKLAKITGKLFTNDTVIKWVGCIDLISNQPKKVPFQCAHLNCTSHMQEADNPFITDSNGLASGNSLLEAVNHALLETIERDALSLWNYKMPHEKEARKVKNSSINNFVAQDILGKIKRAELEIGIWDISTDIGIPAFLCKIIENDFRPDGTRPALGSGAHLSKDVALLRAISEAAQSRLTFISGARDDQYASNYKMQTSYEEFQKRASEIRVAGTLSYTSIPDFFRETFEEDHNIIVHHLGNAGITEILMINLTKPQFNIPVVKVIVPGLEGISFSGKRILGDRGKRAYFAKREAAHA